MQILRMQRIQRNPYKEKARLPSRIRAETVVLTLRKQSDFLEKQLFLFLNESSFNHFTCTRDSVPQKIGFENLFLKIPSIYFHIKRVPRNKPFLEEFPVYLVRKCMRIPTGKARDCPHFIIRIFQNQTVHPFLQI